MERLPESVDAEVIEPNDSDNYQLRKEVDHLNEQVESLRSDFRKLASLVNSARIVYGNSSSATAAPSAANGQELGKWERLKEKLGGKMAEIIDALQLTGTATRTQLKNQTGGALGTIDQAVYKLRDMGLLVKNGDGWSLKQ